MVVNRASYLWSYLSSGQKGLITTGEFLLSDIRNHNKDISDYSFLVFPFAKAYEGFLKQFFLDMSYINRFQYESTHFRIGKVLNPNLVKQLGIRSVYMKISNTDGGEILAQTLWNAWKRGRNLLFHYFPHNLQAITLVEADTAIGLIVSAMNEALTVFPQSKDNNVLKQQPAYT